MSINLILLPSILKLFPQLQAKDIACLTCLSSLKSLWLPKHANLAQMTVPCSLIYVLMKSIYSPFQVLASLACVTQTLRKLTISPSAHAGVRSSSGICPLSKPFLQHIPAFSNLQARRLHLFRSTRSLAHWVFVVIVSYPCRSLRCA